MKIAVIGLWHLGAVISAGLASVGHEVIAYDEQENILEDFKRGEIPVYDLDLSKLLKEHSKNILFTSDPQKIHSCPVVWLAHDTPVDERDHGDVDYVFNRIINILPFLGEKTLVLLSSQLPAGSTERVEHLYHQIKPAGKVSFAYIPENISLGKGVDQFLKPERILAGIRKEEDKSLIQALLKPFSQKFLWMSVESAEMTKLALNAFLAYSVSFINELGGLCEQVGASISEVEEGLKSDSKIGPKVYLKAGNPYVGGTLARDLAYLIDIGRRKDVPHDLFYAIGASNDTHKNWPRLQLQKQYGNLKGCKIAVLGLFHKPQAKSFKSSYSVETCCWLKNRGAQISVYDPSLSAMPEYLDFIKLCPSYKEALMKADVAWIAAELPEFKSIQARDLVEWMEKPTILDPGGFLAENISKDPHICYIKVGEGKKK